MFKILTILALLTCSPYTGQIENPPGNTLTIENIVMAEPDNVPPRVFIIYDIEKLVIYETPETKQLRLRRRWKTQSLIDADQL